MIPQLQGLSFQLWFNMFGSEGKNKLNIFWTPPCLFYFQILLFPTNAVLVTKFFTRNQEGAFSSIPYPSQEKAQELKVFTAGNSNISAQKDLIGTNMSCSK